jgi:N-alpha-acetyltransferase 50
MVKTQAELGGITKHNLKMVKRLNQVIFPVSYNDQFYNDILKAGEMAKLAYYNDLAVGAVCCRLEVPPACTTTPTDGRRLYIMTLGCLAPYRRHKIGTLLLQHVLALCQKDGFTAVTLHVQVNNEAALAFYKKFGFEIVGKSEQYYKRIEPADAFLLEKKMTPSPSINAGLSLGVSSGDDVSCSLNGSKIAV